MKKFKLMQILPSLNSGGVEQGTIDVANYLATLSIENFILSNGGKMTTYLNRKYIQHNTQPVHSKNFFMMPFIANKINKIIKKENIDILHFRSRAPAWLLPYLYTKNIKLVSTFHNIYGSQNFFKRIYNKQLSKVDKIVAISNYVKEEIELKYKIDPNIIRVINRGVDINFLNSDINDQESFIKFIRDNNINSDKKIILFPGRLTSWKGQIEFLEVVEYFKDQPIVFYFVGDNKNNSYYKKLIQEINLKKLNNNCRILGHLNKDKLKIMFQCSDLIISAPIRPEGFGRVISEALSMKKIILAYNYGGAKDQLNFLDNLYKITPLKISEMIAKINIALKLDKEDNLKMGMKAREHVVKNFSKEKMLKSYLNFYQEL